MKLRDEILETNTELFGELIEYKKDDVVVWKGFRPAILIIGYDFKCDYSKHYGDCAKSNLPHGYDSLHYSNLRLATEEEIGLIKNLKIFEL